MGAHSTKPIYVTAHAVTRYVQRVLGIVSPVPDALVGHAFEMHLHLYAAGITLEQAERAILAPAVVAAVNMGVPHIDMSWGRVVVKLPQRSIVTIQTLDMRPKKRPTKRFKEKSRREHKREARQVQTRGRRRPVPA